MQALQSVQEFLLGSIDLFSRVEQGEKLALVYFRKVLLHPGVRRPLHREKVALHRRQLGSSLEGPRQNRLTGLLPYLAEGNKRLRRWDRSLLFKLALCRFEAVLARIYDPFWDRPGPFIFPGPEWSAWVNQEYL